jgi:holo-[acyl-carrier protein] synthase
MKTLVGFDLVDCERCAQWIQFSDRALCKVFSPEEIRYCRHDRAQSASRFAARFAAREALYKALTPLQHAAPMPFLAFCQSVMVVKSTTGAPQIELKQEAMTSFYDLNTIVHLSLSLSHTVTTAGALVALTVAL